MTYVVYGLEDPRDYMYHYIGITDDVYQRFNQHITGSGGNLEKNGWIFECRQDNIMIIMREIERVELIESARRREEFWCMYYLHLGHPLNNDRIVKPIIEKRKLLEEKYIFEERIKILETEKSELTKRCLMTPDMEQQIIEYWDHGISARAIEKLMKSNGLPYNQIAKVLTSHRPGWHVRFRKGNPVCQPNNG